MRRVVGSIVRDPDFERRIAYCAWEWLRSRSDLSALDGIKARSGLGSLPDNVFFERLDLACTDVEREHQALTLWVRRCRSLLEVKRRPLLAPPFALSAGSTLLGLALQEILDYRAVRSDKAQAQAGAVAKKALKLAGQAVCKIISEDASRCDFWANLMVPVAPVDLTASIFAPPEAQANLRQADELWKDAPPHITRLVVVSETTDETDHLGFWLPVVSKSRNSTPGALSAYRRKTGSAVLLDDLPPFGSDLPQSARKPWEAYLRRKLNVTAFVSIPLVVQPGLEERTALAVLNINIGSDIPNDCARAYHGQWLEIAQRLAEPLVCEALKAFAVQHAILDNSRLPSLSLGPLHFPLLEINGPAL